jgi:hypothetical protein
MSTNGRAATADVTEFLAALRKVKNRDDQHISSGQPLTAG